MKLADDPRLQAYLARACRGIRSRVARERVRDELLDHLEEAIAEGRDLPEALEALGDPKALSASLATVHRPAFLEFPFIAAVVASLGVITILAFSQLAQRRLQRETLRISMIIDAHQARFDEDQRVLAGVPFFAFPGKERDAGIDLNPRIGWDNRGTNAQSRAVFSFLDRPSEIALPVIAREKLRALGRAWPKAHPQALDAGIDLGWMKRLERYDHWDLFAWQPMSHALRDMSKVPWYEVRLPDYASLQGLTKLRLLRGLREHRLLEALREVRQLARLVYSSETVVSSMVGIEILRLERTAYEQAVSESLLRPRQWAPMTEEVLVRAKRALFAYPTMFLSGGPIATMAAYAHGRGGAAGYCAAVAESAVWTLILRERIGETPYPFEIDFGPRFARVDDLVTNPEGPCRLRYVRALHAQPAASASWFDGPGLGSWNNLKWRYLSRIPWIRQDVILGFWEIATTDYMSGPYGRNRLPGE